jgi:hypothetical protein
MRYYLKARSLKKEKVNPHQRKATLERQNFLGVHSTPDPEVITDKETLARTSGRRNKLTTMVASLR